MNKFLSALDRNRQVTHHRPPKHAALYTILLVEWSSASIELSSYQFAFALFGESAACSDFSVIVCFVVERPTISTCFACQGPSS